MTRQTCRRTKPSVLAGRRTAEQRNVNNSVYDTGPKFFTQGGRSHRELHYLPMKKEPDLRATVTIGRSTYQAGSMRQRDLPVDTNDVGTRRWRDITRDGRRTRRSGLSDFWTSSGRNDGENSEKKKKKKNHLKKPTAWADLMARRTILTSGEGRERRISS